MAWITIFKKTFMTLPYIQNMTTLAPASIIDKALSLATKEVFPFSIIATPHEVNMVTHTVKAFIASASRIVFCGIGGSCLSGRVFSSYKPEIPVTFLENVDPLAMEEHAETWDWSSTHFVFTSKSGETAETLAQLNWVKAKLSGRLAKKCLILTQPTASTLRTFAQDHAIPLIDLDTQVPGRFSAFTPTGLVPLLCAGGDVLETLESAYNVYNAYVTNPQDHPATRSVAWILWNHNNQRSTSVLMPYAQKHYPLTLWWRQLWAESLGKKGCEFLPVDAYGTTDQHSQLQLYLDGTDSRYFTFILPESSHPSPQLQECAELLHKSAQATCSALHERQRPLRTWSSPSSTQPLNAFLASLMMHMFLETVLVAKAYSLNPFDQPAVELIKHHLRSL